MFTGQEHRADSDPRGEDVRESHLHPELWHRGLGRTRSRRVAQSWWLFREYARWFFGRPEQQHLLYSEHDEDASRLPHGRTTERPGCQRQWIEGSGKVRARQREKESGIGLCFLLLACLLSCSRESPQAAFDHANQTLLHGDLKQAQDEAHRECQRFQGANPEWAWKFRTLEARATIQRGLYEDALKLLKSAPLPSNQPDLVIPVLTLVGEADA